MRFSTVDEKTLSESDIDQAKRNLKKLKKGSPMAFNHHQHGTVKGTYGGIGSMGGRSYAKVHHAGGTTYVPVHQVKPIVKEDLDEGKELDDFDPKKPGYLLKKSSLGHHFIDAHVDSPIGKKAMASGHYTTKKIKSRDGHITHIVPKSSVKEENAPDVEKLRKAIKKAGGK
jgi:hypothetical protein